MQSLLILSTICSLDAANLMLLLHLELTVFSCTCSCTASLPSLNASSHGDPHSHWHLCALMQALQFICASNGNDEHFFSCLGVFNPFSLNCCTIVFQSLHCVRGCSMQNGHLSQCFFSHFLFVCHSNCIINNVDDGICPMRELILKSLARGCSTQNGQFLSCFFSHFFCCLLVFGINPTHSPPKK